MGNLNRNYCYFLLYHASSTPYVHMLALQHHSNHHCHHRCQRSRKFHHCLCQMACLYSIWNSLNKIVPRCLSIGRYRHQGLPASLLYNLIKLNLVFRHRLCPNERTHRNRNHHPRPDIHHYHRLYPTD